ncbi:hypothetical protein IG631_19048 [Alternaria alternata]|nr:hypothetical protein IG631_19048 [Alternaria alternata]
MSNLVSGLWMSKLFSATRLSTCNDGHDLTGPASALALPLPPRTRCLVHPAVQHSTFNSLTSRSVTTSKNGLLHTLLAVLEKVNRLFLFVIKLHDVSALTTDLCITLLTISFLLYHPDECALRVRLVHNNIAPASTYPQPYRRALEWEGFNTNIANSPPPRPVPKPHPTGSHQSGICKVTSAVTNLEAVRNYEGCGSRHQRGNKPPPRPAPNPYPTGPHQSSIKRPNEPPPRPAPNPYPTGPHQS